MSPAATWHGTAAEWGDLWLAIEAHCDCTYDLLAVQAEICAAHLMLTQQGLLDHLVHGRRLRAWFADNEFCTAFSGAPVQGRTSDTNAGIGVVE